MELRPYSKSLVVNVFAQSNIVEDNLLIFLIYLVDYTVPANSVFPVTFKLALKLQSGEWNRRKVLDDALSDSNCLAPRELLETPKKSIEKYSLESQSSRTLLISAFVRAVLKRPLRVLALALL